MEDLAGVSLISRRTNILEQWLIDDGSRDGFVDPRDQKVAGLFLCVSSYHRMRKELPSGRSMGYTPADERP